MKRSALIDIRVGTLYRSSITVDEALLGLLEGSRAGLQLLGKLVHPGDGQIIGDPGKAARALPCPGALPGFDTRWCGIVLRGIELLRSMPGRTRRFAGGLQKAKSKPCFVPRTRQPSGDIFLTIDADQGGPREFRARRFSTTSLSMGGSSSAWRSTPPLS